MIDRYNRTIDYIRISVTDRCDLRCVYCMPEHGVEAMPHTEILRYEDIIRLARIFAGLGLQKIRLTGGEPLVRKDLHRLVRGLKEIPGIEQVSVTTNGMLLGEQLDQLVEAGLDGVNISLDALEEDVFRAVTRRSGVSRALDALEKALACPQLKVKINCVPTGLNDSQLVPLAELARDNLLSVRFIELMPIGLGATLKCRSEEEIRAILEQGIGPLVSTGERLGNGPCRYFRAEGFRGRIGFISALSHKFCDNCNRVRLTADGFLKTCLQYDTGVRLRPLLDRSDEELRSIIEETIMNKPDCHHFTETAPHKDDRRMHQIGG